MVTFGYSALAVRETPTVGYPKPRLLDRVREAIRTRHYSRRTEKAYVAWIKRYIFFHGKRHPAEMGAAEVTRFLTSLAIDAKVAASTQNQALNALVFLYRVVLEQELPWLDEVVRARRPQHLPVVLTREEVRAVLERLDGAPRLMAVLLYGAGLRLLECARLRVTTWTSRPTRSSFGQGSCHDVAGGCQAGLDATPGRSAPPARSRSAWRCRLGGDAGRAGTEVPRRWSRVGLAVGIPGHPVIRRLRHGPAPAAITCTSRCYSARSRSLCAHPESPSMRAATPCVTRSRPICWKTATTSAPSRSCSDTATWRPR
jgi:Phage integrase, N-terminal SAM-like domain